MGSEGLLCLSFDVQVLYLVAGMCSAYFVEDSLQEDFIQGFHRIVWNMEVQPKEFLKDFQVFNLIDFQKDIIYLG